MAMLRETIKNYEARDGQMSNILVCRVCDNNDEEFCDYKHKLVKDVNYCEIAINAMQEYQRLRSNADWGKVLAGTPFQSQHRLPLSGAILYHFRWRLNNMKLMLADAKELRDKYKLEWAAALYTAIEHEAKELCKTMLEIIHEKIAIREQLGDE